MKVLMLFFGAAVFLGVNRGRGGAFMPLAAAFSAGILFYLGYT